MSGSESKTVTAAPDQPPPEKARPRGLAGLSTALQAMAQIERVMRGLPEGERPKVVAWFAAEYAPPPKDEPY